MDPQLLQAIKVIQESPPPLLQSLAYGATITAAIVAIVALFYTAAQIKMSRRAMVTSAQAAESSATTQRARFLLELDQIYENQEIRKARSDFYHKYEELSKDIKEKLKSKTDAERNMALKNQFSDLMFQSRDSDMPTYLSFLSLCGFFETVGLLCKKGHVDLEEILDLYAPAISALADATEAHITLRWEREPHLRKIWMNNLTFLFGKTREYIEARRNSP